MKLVAATRVLNESDIIEAFVRHTAAFVDHHLFIDNGSVDGTLDILQKLQAEGTSLTVFQSRSRSFIESQALTLMHRQAVVAHRADWVILLDTDEFIDDRALGRSLRDHLSAIPNAWFALRVRLRDYQLTPDDLDDLIVPCRMIYCTPLSHNLKVIVRGHLPDQGLVIQPGSHSANFGDGASCPAIDDPSLTLAHYPTRSHYQWLSKAVIGWSKILAAGQALRDSGHALHYRATFESLRTDPRQMLRDRSLLEPPQREDVSRDPIDYRGGALRYTDSTDYPMRTIQVVMQYLHDLAVQHGDMLELTNRLGDVVRRAEAEIIQIL